MNEDATGNAVKDVAQKNKNSCQALRHHGDDNLDVCTVLENSSLRQIFCNVEETMLERYFLRSSGISFRLTCNQAKLLAFECAKQKLKCPYIWMEHTIAG